MLSMRSTVAAKNIFPEDCESVNCPLCSCEQKRPVMSMQSHHSWIEGVFTAVRCENCGTVYLCPRPRAATCSRHYSSLRISLNESGHLHPPARTITDRLRGKWRLVNS